MGQNGESKLEQLLRIASMFGTTKAVSAIQSALVPKILEIFTEHSHDELKRMIMANYPLVRKETPEGIKRTLDNLGSNPSLRKQWEGVVLEYVRPENILYWLKHPEEWLDEAEADAQREELQRCAEVIETTAGGREWLEAQVLQLYEFAHILPEDSTPVEAND